MSWSGWGGLNQILDDEEERKRKQAEAEQALAQYRAQERSSWAAPLVSRQQTEQPVVRSHPNLLRDDQGTIPMPEQNPPPNPYVGLTSGSVDTSTPQIYASQSYESPTPTYQPHTPTPEIPTPYTQRPQLPGVNQSMPSGWNRWQAPQPQTTAWNGPQPDVLRGPYQAPNRPMVPTLPQGPAAKPPQDSNPLGAAVDAGINWYTNTPEYQYYQAK